MRLLIRLRFLLQNVGGSCVPP